jgi:hypothetical protein
MTLGRESRTFFSVKSFDAVVTIVESGGKVCRGAPGFSTANLSIIDDYHGSAGASELIRCRHSGDSGPNDAHIGSHVLRDAGEFWRIS